MTIIHSHRRWTAQRRDIDDARIAAFVVGVAVWSLALFAAGGVLLRGVL